MDPAANDRHISTIEWGGGVPEAQVNPFMYLPEDKLSIIREYFEKSEFAGTMDFERYLAWLHEDDLIPEEVLDVIASYNSTDRKVHSSLEELLASLKSGYSHVTKFLQSAS